MTQLVSSSICGGDVLARRHVGRQADDRRRRPYARASRRRRRIADAVRRKARRLLRRVRRCAISIASRAGGRAVVHRGVGDLHAGQRRDLRLEFEQDLQRALRDLRLIGRVAGEEFRALDQVIDASPAHGVRRRRRRERTAPSRPRRLRAASAAMRRSTAISLLRERHVEQAVDPLVGGNVGEQRVDRRRRRCAPASPRGRWRQAADSACVSGLRLQEIVVGGLVHQLVELRRIGELEAKQPALAQRILVDQARASPRPRR